MTPWPPHNYLGQPSLEELLTPIAAGIDATHPHEEIGIVLDRLLFLSTAGTLAVGREEVVHAMAYHANRLMGEEWERNGHSEMIMGLIRDLNSLWVNQGNSDIRQLLLKRMFFDIYDLYARALSNNGSSEPKIMRVYRDLGVGGDDVYKLQAILGEYHDFYWDL